MYILVGLAWWNLKVRISYLRVRGNLDKKCLSISGRSKWPEKLKVKKQKLKPQKLKHSRDHMEQKGAIVQCDDSF